MPKKMLLSIVDEHLQGVSFEFVFLLNEKRYVSAGSLHFHHILIILLVSFLVAVIKAF